ncbi:MAG: hypothetical protein ACLP05_09150 [Candidatus Kryptoniota bacterium]
MKKVLILLAIAVAASAVVALVGAKKKSDGSIDDGTDFDYLGV